MASSTFLTTVLATILSLATVSSAADSAYTLTDDLSYKNFFSGMNFYTGPDPTQGFVQYQGVTDAVNQKLIGHLKDTKSVFMGVDHTTKDPKGRASVRVESHKTWNIAHMPASTCGTWPAFWVLGKETWPVGGEIDIIEGVNDQTNNAMTLHTSKGCTVNNASTTHANLGATNGAANSFTGMLATSNCDVQAANQGKNVGCSIQAPKTASGPAQMGSLSTNFLSSYGTDFNAANGGIYALDWTSTSISVYFFPHNSPLYKTVSSSKNPNPNTWGTPMARFSGDCDFQQRFRDMRVIFDTTFCGDWAGSVWEESCAKKTGAKTCVDYVRDNPKAFADSFWEIRRLKWYQKGGAKASAPRGRFDRGQ
jgi:hypothetical protein